MYRSYNPPAAARSVIRRQDEIKWQELLTHFRQIQFKHERARQRAIQHSSNPTLYPLEMEAASSMPMTSTMSSGTSTASKLTGRRKMTAQPPSARSSGDSNARRGPASKSGSISGLSGASRPLSPPVSTASMASRRVVSVQQPLARPR